MITLSLKLIFKYTLLTLSVIMAIAAFILYWILQLNNGYRKLPKEKDLLFEHVKPYNKTEYWAYLTADASGKIIDTIYESGDLPMQLNIKSPHGSLFRTNVMMPVYKFIVYLDHGNLRYVTDHNDLKNFIGVIDNMQEALIMAYSLGFSYTDEYGTGYREVNQTYEFVLNRVTTCPYTKETTYLKFDKQGVTKIEKRHTENYESCLMF